MLAVAGWQLQQHVAEPPAVLITWHAGVVLAIEESTAAAFAISASF